MVGAFSLSWLGLATSSSARFGAAALPICAKEFCTSSVVPGWAAALKLGAAQGPAHCRHRLVNKREHRAAERTADERRHHRLSQYRRRSAVHESANKRYLNIELLKEQQIRSAITA